MTQDEIKAEIEKLPINEQNELIGSLTPRFVKLTPEERAKIREEAAAIPKEDWIDWVDLKKEMGI